MKWSAPIGASCVLVAFCAAAGAAPTVAVFREAGFAARGAASAPESLAELLASEGIETEYVSAEQLADPESLDPERHALVLLPYGESFPAAAREAFVAYLRSGGDFVSMGGYTFSHLLVREGAGWAAETDVLAARLAEATRPDRSVLADGGFEAAESGDCPVGGRSLDARWRRSAGGMQLVSDGAQEGDWCATATRSGEVWYLDLAPQAGRRYRVSGWLRTRDVRGRGYAFMALYEYDGGDEVVRFRDFAQVRGTAEWTHYSWNSAPGPQVRRLRLMCGLYEADGEAAFDDLRLSDITGLQPVPMNTSTGDPQDGLVCRPEQIGAFDAGYPLRRVAELRAAPEQYIFPARAVLAEPCTGWAASGVRGEDESRWMPLLMAYDRYGRPRGSAGSLLAHYAGFYQGSAWGYFGVDDRDLFRADLPAMREGLVRLVRSMLRGLYLRPLSTEFAAYPPGSRVRVTIGLTNDGREVQSAKVEVSGGEPAVRQAVLDMTCRPGETVSAAVDVELPRSAKGVWPIRARLRCGCEIVDEVRTAVVAQRPLDESGPRLTYAGNYFRVDGRPLFLFGCDSYANVYTSSCEGPLWWAREHEACRDYGFQLYENLQYVPRTGVPGPGDWRRFEGMTQLAQERGRVFMPGLLIGRNVAVSDEQAAAEEALCAEYARRLGSAPGLLWYINGDFQLRYDDREMLKEKWNAFLRSKYGTTDAVREAWGAARVSAELGNLPFPPETGSEWEDAAAADEAWFRVALTRDWLERHVAAIRARDGAHPITSEYYSEPVNGIDLRLTINGQDVANIGYFGKPGTDIEYLPLRLRWNDLRARGKSVSLGEYGVKTHPAWTEANGAQGYHIRRSEEQQKQLFMAVAHYAFGMGASKVQNWCLRDSNERVFPWGVFHPGPLVPKDVAFVHRNLSLVFSLFAPRYEPPPVTVLLCDAMRLGNAPDLGVTAGCNAFRTLLDLHVDFNVLSEMHLSDLPLSTRAVVAPAALCLSDESFGRLRDFARAGGQVLLTGDISRGADRRRSRVERLKELCGVRFVRALHEPPARATAPTQAVGGLPGGAAPMVAVEAEGAEVLQRCADGTPLLMKHDVARGTVFFCTDALELADAREAEAARRAIYGRWLESAGIEPLPVEPDDPTLHVFAQTTRTGAVHVVFDTPGGEARRQVTLPTKAGNVALGLRDGYPGLAAVTDAGAVLAVGGFGWATVAGAPLVEGDCLAAVASLDGQDLRRSEAVVLLPFGRGTVQLRRSRTWRRPVVVWGDIHDGAFRALEKVEPQRRAKVELAADEDRATLVALLCETGALQQWSRHLGRLASEPQMLPGY